MNVTRIKFLIFFGAIFLWGLVNNYLPVMIVFGFILVVGFFVTSKENNKEWEDQMTHGDGGQRILCYYGDELNFSNDTIVSILDKHFPYFVSLNRPQQIKFLQRLDEFIKTKTFKIHDRKGFKEMPVLISATAIQLSFGLEQYLLPQFEFVHIYPEEFIRRGSIDFLKGNVSGQSINISWKHFLEDYQYPTDGQNVGLHEMAHAYYYQSFITKENRDKGFVSAFPRYNNTANKIFELEKSPGHDLYPEYALRNFQEFWAETIEIFFEKPGDLNNVYPDLYSILRDLLNQDPVNNNPSMIS